MAMAVTTNKLVKKFKHHLAVDALSLHVPQGSIYGFLGPNGAGKTTTIKMLTGMTEPTSGTMEIFGERVELGSLIKRSDIGFLPDVPGFYDWMTAKAFVLFSGRLYNIEKKTLEERTNQLLELVGLKDSVNRKVGTFSRGMKQRLGIAQALINNPKIIFLDEPVSALDPVGRKEVMDVIARLAGKVTVFFSTHILADVERVCDRVVIIDKGKVVLEDSIVNIKKKTLRHQLNLEVEKGDIKTLIKDLSQSKYIDALEQDNNDIRVFVNDFDQARISINKALFDREVLLKKFEVAEATLEDIFMEVVSAHA